MTPYRRKLPLLNCVKCLFIGVEAKKLYHDAQKILHMICRESCIKAHGTIALYPAFRDGDDVKILDEGRDNVIGTLHGLRQQVRKSATASLHFSVHTYVQMYVCNFVAHRLVVAMCMITL